MSSDWPLVAVEDVCELIVDCVNKTAPVVPTATPYRMIRTTNVRNGRIDLNDCRCVEQETYDKWTRRARLQAGDVILTREAPIGEVGLVKEYEGVFLGQRLMQYRANPKLLDSRFLLYSFLSPALQHQFGSHEGSGSVVSHIRVGDCFKFKLRLPPLSEQKKIADLLGALDDRIALLRETNATLEAVAQALFKSWFVDFDPVHARARGEQPAGLAPEVAALFPDSFEESELGMVPKGWKIGTLASVANFQNGYAFKSKDWRETGHPVVKIGDVKPGIIDFSGCSYIDPETTEGLSRFKLERGDLLVGMTGYVGETGLVPHVKPHAYLNQRVGRIATRSGLADLGFVYCLVRNPAFKGYAEAHSHGSAQANVSGAVLLDYATFIPTKDLLNHFNGVVGEMLESILSNHEQAQTLATLRDTLLPRLISGQLRLPEAEAQLSEAGLCQ